MVLSKKKKNENVKIFQKRRRLGRKRTKVGRNIRNRILVSELQTAKAIEARKKWLFRISFFWVFCSKNFCIKWLKVEQNICLCFSFLFVIRNVQKDKNERLGECWNQTNVTEFFLLYCVPKILCMCLVGF